MFMVKERSPEMSQHVRVGVISTSWWADAMYLPSLKSHPTAEIAAICGRNRDRAEEMAVKYGIPRVFTDYGELIQKGELDAIVVATPDDLHYPMTMDALDAGLHVLCEKPMALNARHAREMYEKAEAVGVKHMVLFTNRWQPHFRYLKRLVDEGFIGRCFHAQFRFLGGYGRRPEYMWRFDGRRANGILGDLGAHLIDFARLYVGEIAKVHADLATFVERPGAEGQEPVPANDSALLTLQFDNGAQGMVQASAVAYQGDRSMELSVVLHGDAGTLESAWIYSGTEASATIRGARHDEEQFRLLAVPDHIRQNLDIADFMDPFVKQSAGPRLFIDAILSDRPVSPDFYDGLKVQEVIDAALESHQSGSWVSLPGATAIAGKTE
jgi:predicted dehydrogenase